MTPRHTIEIATRHQVYLERLKTQYANDYVQIVDTLSERLENVMRAQRVDTISQLRRSQLNKLSSELRSVVALAADTNNKEFEKRLEQLGNYEQDFESRSIKQVVSNADVRTITAAQAYAVARQRPLAATGELLRPFLESWSLSTQRKVDAALRVSWAEGQTVQQTTRNLIGTRAANYRDGILNATRREATAVVRTSIQHVSQSARSALWEQNDDIVIGYRWVSTLDSVTTARCRLLDGHVFLNRDNQPKRRPPIHVGCRSTTAPEFDGRLSFMDEGGTRSSASGPVSAKESYYSWLKKQPAAFQNDAIGPTRAKLLREGGMSAERFRKLNLGRDFQPITLEQMRQREPAVFERLGL